MSKKTLEINQVSVDLIKPYHKNAKKHPKKQVEQVAASIKEFGFNQPLVLDRDGVLIVGHGRLEAAKLLGLKEVPAITVNLSEAAAKAQLVTCKYSFRLISWLWLNINRL